MVGTYGRNVVFNLYNRDESKKTNKKNEMPKIVKTRRCGKGGKIA